jgi:hypothetical protein
MEQVHRTQNGSDAEPGARNHRMERSGGPTVEFDSIGGSDRLTGEARDVPFCAAVWMAMAV